jgi:signal transduction histidine kinase
MRERAAIVGGSLWIDSSDEGTQVRVVIPVDRAERSAG